MGRLTRSSAAEKLELIRLVEESPLPVKQTLEELDLPRSTFYRWYDRYLEVGYEGLEDRSPQPKQFWNRIPDSVREHVVQVALEQPEKSPRELACHITDTEEYFISEFERLPDPQSLRPHHQSGLHPAQSSGQVQSSHPTGQPVVANRLHPVQGGELGLLLPVHRH